MKGFIELDAGPKYPGEKVLLNVSHILTVKPDTGDAGSLIRTIVLDCPLIGAVESYEEVKRMIAAATGDCAL